MAIYKADTPDLTTVLLESDGFGDLLTRIQYLKEINGADTALVRRVEELRNGVRSWLGRVRYLRTLAGDEVVRIGSARDDVARIRARCGGDAGCEPAPCSRSTAGSARESALADGGLDRAGASASGCEWPGRQRWADGWRMVGDYTIPQSIVMCESGGNYNALNPSSSAGGAYQFLPDTYRGLGGRFKAPHLAPKWEQDQLAAKLWNGGAGRGNWEC